MGRTLGNSGTNESRAGFQLEPRPVPLMTGSVKANIGHLECAAGMASLVKSCMVAANRTIPRTIHVSKPNRLIAFERLAVSLVLQEATLAEDKDVHQGLSGFGFGGTNGHLVLRTVGGPQAEQRRLASMSRSDTHEKVRAAPLLPHTLAASPPADPSCYSSSPPPSHVTLPSIARPPPTPALLACSIAASSTRATTLVSSPTSAPSSSPSRATHK
eukprot:6834276-Prymnesium_polylepis.1